MTKTAAHHMSEPTRDALLQIAEGALPREVDRRAERALRNRMMISSLGLTDRGRAAVAALRDQTPRVGARVRPVYPNRTWGDGVLLEVRDGRGLKPLVVANDNGTIGYFHADQIVEA